MLLLMILVFGVLAGDESWALTAVGCFGEGAGWVLQRLWSREGGSRMGASLLRSLMMLNGD